jgi:hypothetical protein
MQAMYIFYRLSTFTRENKAEKVRYLSKLIVDKIGTLPCTTEQVIDFITQRTKQIIPV